MQSQSLSGVWQLCQAGEHRFTRARFPVEFIRISSLPESFPIRFSEITNCA